VVVQLPSEPEVDTQPAEIDAGVIDDARARHRRERWVGAIVAALAVIAGLLFGFGGGGGGGAGAGRHGGAGGNPGGASRNSTKPATALALRGVSANEFGLMSSGTGWGVLQNGFEVTRDGGLRWQLITGAAQHGARYGRALVKGLTLTDSSTTVIESSSPSARVAAIAVEGAGAAPSFCKQPRYPSTGVPGLLITADAGRSWTMRALPGCNGAESVSFVNARIGYVDVYRSTGESQIYETVDGARHWRLRGHFAGPSAISFGSREDGLATVNTTNQTATPAVYRTTDGGRSWERVRFCGATPDPSYTVYCGNMTSFGRRGVVLAVAQRLAKVRSDAVLIYTTSDGGNHWVRHRLPLQSPQMPQLSAPNASDLFAYSPTGVLYTSTDGGSDWSSIPQPGVRDVVQMQFVNADYGWLNSGDGLEYTRDGGRNWAPVGRR
jgi:photosystem II stability/assembly factor-like uncharacterized protein